MIVLGSAFLRAGFLSPGAVGNEVVGDEFEHRTQQGLLFAWHAPQGFEARAPMAKGIGCAFETDAGEVDLMADRRLLHQRADQVVRDGVHHDFLLHHRWSLAAQHIHTERDFDFAEVEFDAPTLKIELAKLL